MTTSSKRSTVSLFLPPRVRECNIAGHAHTTMPTRPYILSTGTGNDSYPYYCILHHIIPQVNPFCNTSFRKKVIKANKKHLNNLIISYYCSFLDAFSFAYVYTSQNCNLVKQNFQNLLTLFTFGYIIY